MVNNKLVALVASSLVSTISAANVIRLNSPGDKTTVVQRSDPIVSFGSVSAHSHDIFGSSAMSPSQTYEQLLQGNCTSMIDANGFEVTPDHSVYWYPSKDTMRSCRAGITNTFLSHVDAQEGRIRLYACAYCVRLSLAIASLSG